MRDGLENWWSLRLARSAPLAVLAITVEEDVLKNTTRAWLRSLSMLRPLVRIAAFCQFKAPFQEVQAMGHMPFAAVDRLVAPNTGLEGGGGDREQSYRAMVTHLQTSIDAGLHPAPVFFGLLDIGAMFPDGQGLIDTLFGVAADIRERRLPSSVAMVSHARTAPTFAAAGLHDDGRTGSAWASLVRGHESMRPDAPGALAVAFFTPGAVEWDLHGGLAACRPSHIGSVVRARRHVYARAAAPGHRSAAAMASAALVDITPTVPVLRLPFPHAAMGMTPAALLDATGKPMPFVTVEEAELATFHEEVELEGEKHDVNGHIVVGWRGPVAEILRMEAEVPAPAPSKKPGAGDGAKPAPSPSAAPDAAGPSPSPGGEEQQEEVGDAEEESVPLLSAFTTLFHKDRSDPHGEQKFQIQRNTLVALAAMAPDVEVTVFTTSEQVEQLCEDVGPAVTCSRDFKENRHGTPLLKSMFQAVEQATAAPVYGYLNADILFDRRLVQALRAVLRGVREKVLHERVLIVGRRTNFDMPLVMSEQSRWRLSGEKDLKQVAHMGARGRQFQTDAEDFFFIRRGSFVWSRIPDFVIGRLAYDNWLVDHAFHDGMDRVDISETVHAVHQTGSDGNKAGHKKRPDVDWNKDLVSAHGGGYDHGHTHHSNWETAWHVGSEGRVMRLRSRPLWHSKNRPKDLAT